VEDTEVIVRRFLFMQTSQSNSHLSQGQVITGLKRPRSLFSEASLTTRGIGRRTVYEVRDKGGYWIARVSYGSDSPRQRF
jgi:hypothetical protein